MDFGDVTIPRSEYDRILTELSHVFDCHRMIRSFGPLFVNNPTEVSYYEAKMAYQHWVRNNPIQI